MNPRLYNTIRIAFALAAFGVVGAMDMEDAIAQDQALPARRMPREIETKTSAHG